MARAARLADRCAIVTGAGRGIGAAVAARFAEEGARVACLDSDQEAAATTAAALGPEAIAVRVDVTDQRSVEAAVQTALGEFGALDVVCNAVAAAGPRRSVRDTPTADWDATIALNLRGTFLVSKHTVALLLKTNGTIVNVASALAFTGWRHASASGPTAAGIVQLTQAMALDYAPAVRVNVVCPGPTTSADPGGQNGASPGAPESPFEGRVLTPAHVADAVLFLTSDDASYMTGAALPVDGGFLAS